jgi:hypothetical protein
VFGKALRSRRRCGRRESRRALGVGLVMVSVLFVPSVRSNRPGVTLGRVGTLKLLLGGRGA